MLRPVSNPANRFVSTEVEWEVPPPPARLEIFEEEARSIVSSNASPDIPFTYSLNPYRGCTHACAYCYARPDHEYLGFGAGTDFDTKLVVKVNAPELLRKKLESRSWTGEQLVFSGDTDCYQPIEGSYRLTRRCLEVCLEYRNPVGLITKSALVRRDVELLAALAREADCHVAISIPFFDPHLARAVEPGAPAPRHRFEALRRLSAAGVPTGVMVAPLIPGLNDSDMPKVLEAAAEAGAQTAGSLLLRLPGAVEQVFLERLQAALPLRYERVLSRLKEMRGGALSDARFHHRMRGSGAHWKAIEDLFRLCCKRLGLRGSRGPTRPRAKTFRRPGRAQMFFDWSSKTSTEPPHAS